MRSRETELLIFFLIIDLLMLQAAIVFVAWVDLSISARDIRSISTYLLHGNLSWIIAYLTFSKKNLYLRDSFVNRVVRITKRQLVFMAVAATIAVVLLPYHLARRFFLEYSLLFYFEKIVLYFIVYRYLKYKRSKNINTVQAAVVGYNDTSFAIRQIIDSNPGLGYNFSGFISSKTTSDENILGHPDELEELIDKHKLNILFYTISFFNGDDAERKGKRVLKVCNSKGVRLRFIPKNQQWFRNRMNMESFGNLVVIDPQEIPLDNVSSRIQKRLFDILFSLAVTVFLLSWLIPVLAILIGLDSKGPVFFVQRRTGIDIKTFNCLKFRSMKVNSNADTQQATPEDKRITKLGRFLRQSNIDELPQFLNVLAGSMSVVGPRPHMLKHTEEYSKLIDQYLIRHYVKPGITGWAQIKGYRGETKHLSAMEKRVKADMEYIENWKFSWDLSIIWLTIFSRHSWKNAG
ncbi:exopolysaccharide biosynthesis polyprenyl glycosylphosphotransferase [Draconibacterium sp. IB214405]|uniref:exopolysaccharide biosynthesis polyprenyl glycosylphosphotransferase n=1 Tax=Draconibacterium sp. IB214405 TaxID=3097352 RepID=UPI002A0F3735|nr:exopolysaccharide biosynthesis polyprenyl glycosylphosphotransferase [Draconibacterium sp. IB214405]MDX8339303.1 exopolysaccharide biosynthesis polyprenyl glycosylphosphotransferase [Draconibacterium sp. IB214405]